MSAPRYTKYCEYVLLAEFDIDEGSMLRHEYPAPTGCDGHLLAELMLPDGAHQRTEDWTIFYLNQTQATTVNRSIVQDTDQDAASVSHDQLDTEQGGVTPLQAQTATGKPELLYVISLVRTKHGSAYKRGALVKALAVCSARPYIQIFKPVLLLALENYFDAPTPTVLKRLYDAINAIDVAAAPQLSLDERLILRCSERKDMFEEKFQGQDDRVLPLTPTFHAPQPYSTSQNMPDRDSREEQRGHLGVPGAGALDVQPRSRVASDNSTISVPSAFRNGSKASNGVRTRVLRDTHYYETSVSYNELSLPIRLPLYTFPGEVGDYSLVTLITAFSNFTGSIGPQHPHLHTNGTLTAPIIVLFNAILTYKRVLFLGSANQPASQVSNFVLSAAALGSGCGLFFECDITERCFPYSNLTNLDNVLGVSGYIAGVSNPRFEDLTSTWDVLCNIETGRIHVSKDIQQVPAQAASTYSASTNASQLSLSTSSTATHSSVPASSVAPRAGGHSSAVSIDFSTTSPEPMSGISGSMPFGPSGAGLPNAGNEGDIGRVPGREASVSSSVGPPASSISAAPSATSSATAGTSTATGAAPTQMPRLEARVDTFDNTFMDEIISAIQSHFGEAVIRARFIDYVRRFIRLASRYEEETYGSTTIDHPTLPFVPGRLGSGLVFYTAAQEEIKRELGCNAGRIEGWRRTKCYEAYKSDWMKAQVQQSHAALQTRAADASLFSTSVPSSFLRAIKGVDLHHQMARLRNSKRMSSEEVEHIMAMLRDKVQTDAQIVELLSHLPSHLGGLLPIAFGLFHPSPSIRDHTVEFLNAINAHPTGSKLVQGLNAFHRLAYARLASERETAPFGSLPGLPAMNGTNGQRHSSQQPQQQHTGGHQRQISNAGSHKSHATSAGSGSGEGLYARFHDKEVPPLPPTSA